MPTQKFNCLREVLNVIAFLVLNSWHIYAVGAFLFLLNMQGWLSIYVVQLSL